MAQLNMFKQYEPRHEKTGFLHMRKQGRRSALFFLNPKFQATSHLLGLYSLVCVGPGRKPRRPVFSQRGSYLMDFCKKATWES